MGFTKLNTEQQKEYREFTKSMFGLPDFYLPSAFHDREPVYSNVPFEDIYPLFKSDQREKRLKKLLTNEKT